MTTTALASKETPPVRLVVASTSPVGIKILRRYFPDLEVVDSGVSNKDERAYEKYIKSRIRKRPCTDILCKCLAYKKAAAAVEKIRLSNEERGGEETKLEMQPGETIYVLGRDNIATFKGEDLSKPESIEETLERLKERGGKRGGVYTGHVVIAISMDHNRKIRVDSIRAKVSYTTVQFKKFTDAELEHIIDYESNENVPLGEKRANKCGGLNVATDADKFIGELTAAASVSPTVVQDLIAGRDSSPVNDLFYEIGTTTLSLDALLRAQAASLRDAITGAFARPHWPYPERGTLTPHGSRSAGERPR